MTTPSRKSSFWFALWDYLNQPVFDNRVKFIFNPVKFTVGYRSQLLERCWTKDYDTEKQRQQLETCWENTATRDENLNNSPKDTYNQLSDKAASE